MRRSRSPKLNLSISNIHTPIYDSYYSVNRQAIVTTRFVIAHFISIPLSFQLAVISFFPFPPGFPCLTGLHGSTLLSLHTAIENANIKASKTWLLVCHFAAWNDPRKRTLMLSYYWVTSHTPIERKKSYSPISNYHFKRTAGWSFICVTTNYTSLKPY